MDELKYLSRWDWTLNIIARVHLFAAQYALLLMRKRGGGVIVGEEIIEGAKRHTPAGRIPSPEDMASVVAFLCFDESDMIRGLTIVVDGGTRYGWPVWTAKTSSRVLANAQGAPYEDL